MEKGGNGDGVSQSGDDDPEVTAITRRFDRTGDTLDAINALEQLLIDRTGQIPVISPELLAAQAARLGHSRAMTDAPPAGPAEESLAEPAEEPSAEPSDEVAVEDGVAEAVGLDWSIPIPAPLDPAPGFSPWVDPEAIAAAIDTAPPEFTDVSTKVFAVFSAERADAERPALAAPASAPAVAPAPSPAAASAPVAAPAPERIDPEELDGVDDPAAAVPVATSAAAVPVPAPAASAAPVAAPSSEAPSEAASPHPATPVAASAAAPAAEEAPAGPRKRRFWLFGRR